MDLREAAGALGVHYQTAYAWGAPGRPARPQGGPRLCPQRQRRPRRSRPGAATAPSLPRPIRVRDWAAQARRPVRGAHPRRRDQWPATRLGPAGRRGAA